MGRKSKVDGNLAKRIEALVAQIKHDEPDRDQVLLKFRAASALAGASGVSALIGRAEWDKLQKILHSTSAQPKQLPAAA